MSSFSSSKMTKIKIVANLGVGLALIAAGIVLNVTGSQIIENTRAIFGLSIIPFGIALSLWLSLFYAKKNPKNMNQIHILENDERLKAIRHQADSTTFLILRWVLMMFYFGYTFLAPEDVFENVYWWVVLGFFMLSYILQGVMNKIYSDREIVEEEEKAE